MPLPAAAKTQSNGVTRRIGIVFGLVLTALALTTGLAGPAEADGSKAKAPSASAVLKPNPAQADTSFYPLRDVATYTSIYDARLNNIIHVDTEHATSDGFWFAIARTRSGAGIRQMGWVYQPYGARCTYHSRDLTFNPWMNNYWCPLNPDRTEVEILNFKSNSQQCQVTEGRPWNYTLGTVEQCDGGNVSINTRAMLLAAHQEFDCAPWEDQRLNTNGVPRCAYITYPYINSPEADPWVPAPDACVGIPAGANTYDVAYNVYSANTDVPTCLGEGNASNCTAATAEHAACGGVLLTEPMQWFNDQPNTGLVRASATKTATADTTRSTVFSKTATATRTARRGTAYKTVTKRCCGRKFTARGSAPIYIQRTVTRTYNGTYSTAPLQVTATRSCDRPTYDEALTCAEALAQSVAQTQADERSFEAMLTEGDRDSSIRADTLAQQAATAATRTSTLTAGDRAPALAKAKRIATNRVNAAIRKWKRTH